MSENLRKSCTLQRQNDKGEEEGVCVVERRKVCVVRGEEEGVCVVERRKVCVVRGEEEGV